MDENGIWYHEVCVRPLGRLCARHNCGLTEVVSVVASILAGAEKAARAKSSGNFPTSPAGAHVDRDGDPSISGPLKSYLDGRSWGIQ